jgi:Undecaprenyl-phosphate galactose phosphotransferase WbaP
MMSPDLRLQVSDVEDALWSPQAPATPAHPPANGQEVVVRRRVQPEYEAAEEELRSVRTSAVVWRKLRRAVRTVAPFIISDIVSLAICGFVAAWVMNSVHPAAAIETAWLAAATLLPLIAGYWLCGIYSEIWVHPAIELRQIVHVNTLMLTGALAGAMVAPQLAVFAAAAWLSSVCIVPLVRTVARAICENRPWWGYPALIIASGEGADDISRMVLDCPRSGLRPLMMTDPQNVCRVAALRVVNDWKTLESLIRREGIRHAVISLPNLSTARLAPILDRYSELIPHLLVLSDAATLPTLWGASRSGGRLSGIEVRNGLLMATLQSFKRVLDLIVALTTLILGLPLLIGIAVLNKLCSRGPIFYGQERIGRFGRRFTVWKFRTMHVNGDQMLREYLEKVVDARAEWDRDQKLRHDPRVTRIGRFLRATSFDELPQIWNVLRGDMSIVGPRPIIDAEIPRYADSFRLYTKMKPGITGLWQVSGRSNVGYEDRVRLDQFYIRHWSPWLDIYILAKTVVALVRREGAC